MNSAGKEKVTLMIQATFWDFLCHKVLSLSALAKTLWKVNPVTYSKSKLCRRSFTCYRTALPNPNHQFSGRI